jgi:hypothetical protein
VDDGENGVAEGFRVEWASEDDTPGVDWGWGWGWEGAAPVAWWLGEGGGDGAILGQVCFLGRIPHTNLQQ